MNDLIIHSTVSVRELIENAWSTESVDLTDTTSRMNVKPSTVEKDHSIPFLPNSQLPQAKQCHLS